MFDPYSGAPIDQWGNPVPPQYHNGYYQQPSPYSGYSNPTYGGPGGPGGQNPQGAPPGGAGYNQYGGANPYPASTSTPRTPFRLHEGQGTNSPSPAGPPGGSPGMQGVGGNPVVKPHSAPAPSRASTSTLPRRLSESQQNDTPLTGSAPMSPTGPGSRPSYSRQASRDSVQGSASPNLPPRR